MIRILLIIILFLPNCLDESIRISALPEGFNIDDPAFIHSIESISSGQLQQGNFVQLLQTGDESFERLYGMLKKAKHTIHIETFLFNSDETTEKITEILIQKAKSGVKVRIIVDAVGGYYFTNEHFSKMQKHHIDVHYYNRWNTIHALRYRVRTHRRAIIVDGKIGMMGGFGLTHWWANPDLGPYPVFDLQVYLEGPAVRQLQEVFINNFRAITGTVLAGPHVFPVIADQGYTNALVTYSNPDRKEISSSIYETYLFLIETAQTEILITTPYLILDGSLLRSLQKAKQRGVIIKIMTTEEQFIPEKPVVYAGRNYYEALLNSNIQLYEFNEGLLHAKYSIFDRKLLLIGSTNLDQRSFKINLENDILIYDSEIIKKAVSIFEAHLNQSIPISLKSFYNRSYWSRFNECLWLPLMHEF